MVFILIGAIACKVDWVLIKSIDDEGGCLA